MSVVRKRNRERLAKAKKLFKLPVGLLEKVDLNKRDHPIWMTRAYISNRYVVMIEDNAKTNKGNGIKVLIQKHDGTPIINHWSEIQKIKNELFGSETTGIEYYPAESELINDHNIYWLWIFPKGVIPIPIH